MERKLSFACDVDDVLADTWEAWRRQLNQLAGTNFSAEEIVSHGLVQNFPRWREYLDIEKVMERFWVDPELNFRIKPLLGAVEGMRRLDTIADFRFYLTGRPEVIRETTADWLRFHGFPKPNEVVLRPADLTFEEVAPWKAKIIRKAGVDFVIDDNPSYLQGIGRVTGFFFKRPFNLHRLPEDERIVVISGWEEVLNDSQLIQRLTINPMR